MRKFLCICFILCGLTSIAQHTATVSSKSDFKTLTGKMIVSDYVLDTELTAAENAEITAWVNSNSAIMTLKVDGKTLKFSVTPESNERNVYEKFFLQCGISTLTIKTGKETKNVTLSEFFALYNL
ncbi:MAG: hypothetical protein ACKVOK_13220 [Flavobacteriales bacterium]